MITIAGNVSELLQAIVEVTVCLYSWQRKSYPKKEAENSDQYLYSEALQPLLVSIEIVFSVI